MEYSKQYAAAEVLGPELERFQRSIRGLNRPGSLIRMDIKATLPIKPVPLTEPNDMVRVDFPCHPEEPLKIAGEWKGEISCLMCGIRYPVELVRVLRESEV